MKLSPKTNSKLIIGLAILILNAFSTLYAQTQLGQDIDGDLMFDWSGWETSISDDGTIVAVSSLRNQGNGVDFAFVRVYQYNGTSWGQIGQDIEGENNSESCGKSTSLSANGKILAIGSPENDGNGTHSGHTRIFEFDGVSWQQKGQDIDGETIGDASGTAVSLSSDGNMVAIGATLNASNGIIPGHVRVFEFVNSNWIQRGQDINGASHNDESGYAISLSSDGNIVAIGAPYNDENGPSSGHVRIFEFDGINWTQKGQDINGLTPNERFGESLSLSADGETVAVGAPRSSANGFESGQARVFQYDGSNWIQVGQNIDGQPDDFMGEAISISKDGSIVAVGAPSNGWIYYHKGYTRVLKYDGTMWIQIGQDMIGEAIGDNSGGSVSLTPNGLTVAIGAVGNTANGTLSGHVRVFSLPAIVSSNEGIIESSLLATIFPNPGQGEYTLKLNQLYKEVNVSVFNSLGKQITQEEFQNSNVIEFGIEGQAGIYFVKITFPDDQVNVVKVVKQNL